MLFLSFCIQHLRDNKNIVTRRIAYGQCCKNEPVTGMSCVRHLSFLACCSKIHCRGNRYITLGLHDIAMVQQEHKYWHRDISGFILKNVRNWKVSVIFLSVRLSESPAFNMLWAAVNCFQAKLLMGLRKQPETVYKQLPSPYQWNLFADDKSFPMSFTIVLRFYRSHYNCRWKKLAWENTRTRLLCRYCNDSHCW